MAQVEHEVLCVALAQLPARRREALIAVGIAGFSYEETAKRCGCPEGTIKSRVNRARAELAELLAIEGCRSSSGAAGSIRRSSSRAAISEAFANFFVRAPRPRSLGACRVAMIDSHFAQMMSAALWSFFSSAFDTSRLMGCTLLHARHHARGNRSSKSMRFHAAAETEVFSRNPAGSR
jgi:predicted DNA-binding protein (UPF0251 family)